MRKTVRFDRCVAALPAPGVGGGYHTAIFRAACLGRDAGLGEESVAEAIRGHTAPGGRAVPDREITEAVEAAFRDDGRGRQPYTGPRVRPGFLAECLRAGRGATVDDIVRRSPVPLDRADEDG